MTDSYYCPNCFKAKISPWGENLTHCPSIKCQKIENREKAEYNRIKEIVLQILQKEKLITITE